MDPFVEWQIKRYARIEDIADETRENLESSVDSVFIPYFPKTRPAKPGVPKAKPEPEGEQKGPSKQETPAVTGSWTDMSMADAGNYVGNIGRGLKGTQPATQQYLRVLAWVIKNYFPGQQAFVTDALRTPERQVNLMIKNWRNNGGNTPIGDKPKSRDSKKLNIKTRGTDYLVWLYANNAMAKEFGEQLETGNFQREKWVEYFDKRKKSHGVGKALDFRSKGKPWMKSALEKTKEFANINIVDETSTAGPHWHVDVYSIKGPQMNVASLNKEALQVTIEPYNSIVMKAMQEIETKQPGYFNQVNKIVLEPGDPGHFGKVQSDQPDTIFVSLDKIKSAIAQAQSEDEIVAGIREVLSHEMGHLKSNFQGGESPAEAESQRIEQLFQQADLHYDLLVDAAFELESAGHIKEAQYIDEIIRKDAAVQQATSPMEMAQSILRVVYHFAQKVKPENQHGYLGKIRNKLMTLDALQTSGKNPNPGAGVGATLTITKHILSGQDPQAIQETMRIVFDGMNRF